MQRQKLWKLETVTKADDYSEDADSWAPVRDVWVRLRPLRSRELERIRQVIPLATHTARIPYKSDVSSGQRFTRVGRNPLHIGSVVNRSEANQWLDLILTEVI